MRSSRASRERGASNRPARPSRLGCLSPCSGTIDRLFLTRPAPLLCSCCLRIEKALRRFRKQTNQVGHLRILRNRKTFESAHDKQIRKAKESAMRKARQRRAERARNN